MRRPANGMNTCCWSHFADADAVHVYLYGVWGSAAAMIHCESSTPPLFGATPPPHAARLVGEPGMDVRFGLLK